MTVNWIQLYKLIVQTAQHISTRIDETAIILRVRLIEEAKSDTITPAGHAVQRPQERSGEALSQAKLLNRSVLNYRKEPGKKRVRTGVCLSNVRRDQDRNSGKGAVYPIQAARRRL